MLAALAKMHIPQAAFRPEKPLAALDIRAQQDKLSRNFALAAERNEGLKPEESIYKACLMRFRPIMMTTMAALLGGLPLMLAEGTGSELRKPLGFAMVGGLLLSQVLTLYTTPVVYLYMDRLSNWAKRGRVTEPRLSRAQRMLHAGEGAN